MEPLNSYFSRRTFLARSTIGAASWLTAAGHVLARNAEQGDRGAPAQSVILLWMAGGPSQLETFDPHPDTEIAGGTRSIATVLKDVQLAEGLEQTAGQMKSISLIRSMVGQEGDHERGTYLAKTGFRPDPTVVHPSIGAICCHELPTGSTDIPRHVSILPGQWPGRGGYLGDTHDAFKTGDPADKVPDVTSRQTAERDARRMRNLDVLEKSFARGRRGRVEATLHTATVNRARQMMTSEQLKAFEVSEEPLAVRRSYGDTPFGRGCLAARRLIEVGVRCVEVTLDGWDTHINNHALVRPLLAVLDPAFAALVDDLRQRGLLDKTVVVCMGEFGRTPHINPAGGRDHWPTGYSVALAGGGLRPGHVLGETDPDGGTKPIHPVSVADLHATILTAVGIDPAKVNTTPIGRTVRISEGKAIKELLRG